MPKRNVLQRKTKIKMVKVRLELISFFINISTYNFFKKVIVLKELFPPKFSEWNFEDESSVNRGRMPSFAVQKKKIATKLGYSLNFKKEYFFKKFFVKW